MKKLIYPLLFLGFFSCKQKEPTQADFMQRALKGDDYKIVSTDFRRVQDSLVKIKTQKVDTNTLIFLYNGIGANAVKQVKTVAQVVYQMDMMSKDSSFLKNVQVHLADTLAKAHRDSVAREAH